MKVALVANTGWYLHNFRRGLIRQLQRDNHEVVVICPWDQYVENLRELGVRWISWNINRRGMNPFSDLQMTRKLAKIYRQERPDVVHHFTVKCVLYGTLAARLTGVAGVVNAITGLGHLAISNRFRTRFLRPFMMRWWAWSLGGPNVRAMFQNKDDLAYLARYGTKLVANATVVGGSGVDLERFSPALTNADFSQPTTVLFAGRLIQEKGIREFVTAATQVRQSLPDVRFVVCGRVDPGNPSSICEDELNAWKQQCEIDFVGHVERLEDRIRAADVVVLPSYREGTPRILLEAAACAKPVIASDVPGCREAVDDRETGYLVPSRNVTALVKAILDLLGDRDLCAELGQAGRARMEALFDEGEVVRQTLDTYHQLLGTKSVSTAGAD